MKVAIIAGEASGDLHGSNLMRAMHTFQNDLEFIGIGGDKMIAQGLKPIRHITQTNFMGFWEVAKNIKTIQKMIQDTKQMLLNHRPDAIILIDYPGFNLHIAKFAYQHGIKVLYYISPQLWAWKKGRVKIIQKYVHKMYVIFPFEKEFYKKEANIEVEFVGHPLLDALCEFEVNSNFKTEYQLSQKPIVAILPGSRKQEIKNMLPTLLSVVDEFPGYQFVIAAAQTVDKNYIEQFIPSSLNVPIIQGQTYQVLAHAYMAIVKSGTSTLETALFNVPEVVVYKGSWLSYQIGKRLVNKKMIKYISIVNLIMGRSVVPELIQNQCNTANLIQALQKLSDGAYRTKMQNDFSSLRKILGDVGASYRCAKSMLDEIKN
ncbi:MAG: lipid-A-disaccharide synthase [Bacteroidia bacterium]|nr:lipid-A-disaccharide synthase [Bacteroidia bacterium]MDW8347448.1 lipid-A-disaccharide synthase [Bacteroidia bacterium]